MEHLAYLYLAEAYAASENIDPATAPQQLTVAKQLTWRIISSRVCLHLLSLAVASTVLGIANQARAQISIGSRGSEVRTLQQQLKELGYFKRTPTGKFGPLTKAAVIRFQKDAGLTPNGIVDSTTEAALQDRHGGSSEAVAAVPSDHPPSDRPLLRRGSSGSEVRSLQEILTNAGAYTGSINGLFNSQTQAAVKQFQRDNGLSADGIVGPQTWGALSNVSTGNSSNNSSATTASSAPPAEGPFNSSSFTNSPTLHLGDRGPTVTAIQQSLHELGYLNGQPNGNFDLATQDAVRRFQQASGLKDDGVVDATTQEAIGTPTSIKRVSISELQKRLKDKGFYKGTVDGIFGQKTRAAVKAAQEAYKVSEDDILKARF